MAGARDPVLERLLAEPQGFDLFQAISLLEREGVARGHAEIGGAGLPEAVRLSSRLSLGFDASDIHAVRDGSGTGEAFTLSSPVLSLGGQAGPLPSPFTEMILERNAAKDFATADFLDIIQHRFLGLFYQGRKRHRLGLAWRSPRASSVAQITDALCALGRHAEGKQRHTPWLRHAGLLGGAPRSMAALTTLLSDRFGFAVSGKQFVGGWLRLQGDELCGLGTARAPALGRSAMLGTRVWDQSAGIRLGGHGLGLQQLTDLLPGGARHDELRATVRHFMPADAKVEVTLAPARAQLPPCRLTASAAPRLGWTAWLSGQPAHYNGAAVNPARFSFECAGHEQ